MENTENSTTTINTNHIEMVDAIQFTMKEFICIYIEKYYIFSYYYPNEDEKSITVIYQNDPACIFSLVKSYSNIKISIKEVERLQMILQLQKELKDLKIGEFSFDIV